MPVKIDNKQFALVWPKRGYGIFGDLGAELVETLAMAGWDVPGTASGPGNLRIGVDR